MKIKKGCEASTSDIYYDLCEGYLDPFKICESQEDAERVIRALEVIKNFYNSCEDQIEGFIQ